MLLITIPALEQWDDEKQEFVYTKKQELRLEHSLVSLAKWESKWCKPFLGKEQKTYDQTIDYIKFMTLTQNVPDDVYQRITKENIDQVNQYIDAPMTATWFSDKKTARQASREQITAEIVYYWMVALNIPFECEKWHLNRLLTLIRVCEIKSQPQKKMSKKELLSRNAALNAVRRKQFNKKG